MALSASASGATAAIAPAGDDRVATATTTRRGEAPAGFGAGDAPAGTGERWGLVLSGGVARGFAHIGVLRALEEEHLRPDLVVGTSMGAIVGALYASGYSSAEIERLMRGIDWVHLLFPRIDALAWRGNVTPRPLLQLGVGLRGVQLPSAPLSDAELNYMLSDLLIEASSAAASYDRLPIPFRAVATDVATAGTVVLDDGPIARSVRASMSIPFVFAPVRAAGRLLVDGGMADNLPMAPAHEAGAGRVVAVDIASSLGPLDSLASGPAAALYLIRLLTQRHPPGTPLPSDLLLRLELKGYGTMDYTALDSLVAAGYRGSIEAMRAYADSVGLPRAAVEAPRAPAPLPPLAGSVQWSGLRTLRHGIARAALGRLPVGPLRPTELRPALGRLYRSALFENAWPSLETLGDSTILSFDVRELPRRELSLAAAYGNDDGERTYARIGLRAPWMPPIALFELTGIRRRYGRAAHANAEPHALGRGGSGPFLRAEYRESETRIFRSGRLTALPRTIRREIFAGAQFELFARQIGQLGVGLAGLSELARRWDGVVLVFRTESRGAEHRRLQAEWMPGPDGYSRLDAWLDVSRKLGPFTAAPALRAAIVDGHPPTDVLAGVGGAGTLVGLRQDEWLGRRAAAAEFRLLYASGPLLTFSATAQTGVVGDAVGAPEIRPHLQPAAGLRAELTTPIGPIRLDWGLASGGRRRFDVMLGDRF